MANNTQFLVQQLAVGGRQAILALDAIYTVADKNPASLIGQIPVLKQFFQNDAIDRRGKLAMILGKIGTTECLNILFATLVSENPKILLHRYDDGYLGCFYEQLLWGISIHKTFEAADLLCQIVCSPQSPQFIRNAGIESLACVLDYVNEPCVIPKACGDIARELVNHSDGGIANGAFQLIGLLNIHREGDEFGAVDGSYRSRFGKLPPQPVRVNFSTADVYSLIRHHRSDHFERIHPEDFEKLLQQVFVHAGWKVILTPYVGDKGADLIIERPGKKIAVQIKRLTGEAVIGVSVVNEIVGAKAYYNCNEALLITTGRFSNSAIETARKIGVDLWDRAKLREFIDKIYP